jgi:hypothetical protein
MFFSSFKYTTYAWHETLFWSPSGDHMWQNQILPSLRTSDTNPKINVLEQTAYSKGSEFLKIRQDTYITITILPHLVILSLKV